MKKPEKIPYFPEHTMFVKVVCGALHTLALTVEGRVYSWGCNDDGALGRSGIEHVPQMITVGLKIRIGDISAGDSHSIVYNTDLGLAYMWGLYRNIEHGNAMEPIRRPLQIGRFEFRRQQIQKIVCGSHHTLYLVGGRVFASGDPDNLNLSPGPRRMKFRLNTSDIPVLLLDKSKCKTVNIFAGSYHSFMVKENGAVYAWGHNNFGQLGIGDFETRHEFRRVLSLNGEEVRSIVGGETHTVALMDKGVVYSWGRNDENQLGFDEETVERIEEEAKVNGWPGKCWPIPRKIKGLDGIAKISAGTNYTYAMDGVRSLYAWYDRNIDKAYRGMGENYVLGNKDDTNIETPKKALKEFADEEKVVDVCLVL